METRKNNDIKEFGESFAIGSKIDYMNKLYEIVENKYCVNCSISDICCNSDVSNNNNNNVLSRDERVRIFGECSPIKRKDRKSVIFKEIPADDDDVYDVEVLYKNDKELLPIRINIPYNFPLNTRRGFRTIYYLMKLSQHNMTTVIKDIIAVRHAGINS